MYCRILSTKVFDRFPDLKGRGIFYKFYALQKVIHPILIFSFYMYEIVIHKKYKYCAKLFKYAKSVYV